MQEVSVYANNSKISDQEMFDLIRKDGTFIGLVDKTPERCFLSVSQNGLALEMIPEEMQTEELCVVAVRQNGRSLRYVSKNATEQ